MSNVGKNIKAKREALGLTQPQLAERMGLKPNRITYISAVENGVYQDLRSSRLAEFASALNCTVNDLLVTVTEQEIASA